MSSQVAASLRSPSAGQWYAVFALTLAYMHSNVARQVVPMFVGPIQADLGLTDVGISLAGGFAFAIFYSVMGVPLGRLVDRTDRRRLILVGIVFWTLMTAVCGWSLSLVLFLAGRIGLGASEAVLVPAALSIFHDAFPRGRLALAVNTFFTGAWLGNGLAFIVGAAVLQAWGATGSVDVPGLGTLRTWQFVFLAVAAAGLPVFLACLPLREPPRLQARPDATGDGRSAFAVIAQVFRAQPRIYWGVFLGVTVYSAAVSGVAFWAVEYFVRTFGSDRAHVSYLYGLQGFLVGSLGLLVSGWLADRWEHRGVPDARLRVGIASLALLLPLGAAFVAAPSEAWGLALVIAVTFLTPIAYGTSASALQSVTPGDMQGVVTGLYAFVTNSIGMGLGPTAVAFATERVAGGTPFLARAIAIVTLVLLPIAIGLLAWALGPYRVASGRRVLAGS